MEAQREPCRAHPCHVGGHILAFVDTGVPAYDRVMTETQNAYEFIEAGGYIEGHRIETVNFSDMIEPPFSGHLRHR